MRSTPPELARSALDAAPDAMVIIDASGAILYANQQVSALFRYPHHEIVGRNVEQLMPERFRTRHIEHRDHYFHRVRVRSMGEGLELFARRSDGSEFPVEISLSPVADPERVLIAAAIRDVTDRKRAEAELITARQGAERAREFADKARESADQARQIADRANQGKSRFLATASHDLRQPLQTLALLNGTLRRLVSEPEAAEALEHQELAIGAMSRLLNALLDISKLESGAIRPEPSNFALAPLLEELRVEFASIAARNRVDFQVEQTGECVHSDPSLIEQILRNLVSNAVKYTPQGRVSLRCIRQASIVRIEVLDTGIGIAQDQLPYIYDEFYQVGVPANSSRNGYGLGLSIVQRLIKLLKLGFEVHSELGKGSAFSLLLPAAAQLSTVGLNLAGSTQPPASLIGRASVLLVEDDPAVRDATRMLLRVEGYQVTAVTSLAEAIQKAREDPHIDLLVTDYHLNNGETGTEVIEELREIVGTPLRAVLITGDTSSAVRNIPLDVHIKIASKPVKAEELLALLRALLAV